MSTPMWSHHWQLNRVYPDISLTINYTLKSMLITSISVRVEIRVRFGARNWVSKLFHVLVVVARGRGDFLQPKRKMLVISGRTRSVGREQLELAAETKPPAGLSTPCR